MFQRQRGLAPGPSAPDEPGSAGGVPGPWTAGRPSARTRQHRSDYRRWPRSPGAQLSRSARVTCPRGRRVAEESSDPQPERSFAVPAEICPTLARMAVRTDIRNIPTVADAVEHYIRHRRVAGIKSIKDEISVLQGPAGRVVGKAAAGPALAKSQLGGLRMDRLEAHDVTEWFQTRHPEHLGRAMKKRGMSSVRGFLNYAVGQGWVHERVLAACVSLPAPNASRDWLRPEQLVAISDLVESGPFDSYQRFAFMSLRETGARAAETVAMQPMAMSRREGVLHVVGKGAGEGKQRSIPVGPDYLEAWDEHVARHGLSPKNWVLFRRWQVPLGGRERQMEMRIDTSTPSSTRPLRRLFNAIDELARQELPSEFVPDFLITPKVMRRTFACTALTLNALGLGGLDIYSLQKAMGHTSLETTAVYLSDVEEYIRGRQRDFDLLGGIREMLEGESAA